MSHSRMVEGRRLIEGPPTPPPTSSTLSPVTLNSNSDKQLLLEDRRGRTDIINITPPSSAPTSSSPTAPVELSRKYPLLSDIPRKSYTGRTSLCDLLDDALDNMTELGGVANGPAPGYIAFQARPISLLRCTSVPVDSPELVRYMRAARQFVRKIEGIIGMWGLGRFMRTLKNDDDTDDEYEKGYPTSVLNPLCSIFALRDGEGSEAERMVNVSVDVRTLLAEVGRCLKVLSTPAGQRREATGEGKEWERSQLGKLANLLDMLLLSLVPAIEELLVDGIESAQPFMQPFVPDGVVGRAGTPWAPESLIGRSITPSPEGLGLRSTTPALSILEPTRTSTSFQLPPSVRVGNGNSSLRGMSIYSRQNSDFRQQPQQDRLSTITANTTGTNDTFMYLARSMRNATEVEGIREEDLGIGRPGRWGVSDDGLSDMGERGMGVDGNKPKWRLWRWKWGWKRGKKTSRDGEKGGRGKRWFGCFRGDD